MPTLDSNVFDVGIFDTRYAVPLVRSVRIEPQAKVIAAGGSVTVLLHLIEAETTYGQKYNLDPESGVQVELLNPDGTIALLSSTMTNLTQGKYLFTFSTNLGSQRGCYSARFGATHGDKTMLTPEMALFTVL